MVKIRKTKKKKSIVKKICFTLIIIIVILSGVIFGISVAVYDGNIKLCVVNIISNIFGGVKTRYILVMGVSEDISTELTDTIILAGYNPDTLKAFIVSIPRDTYVGKTEASVSANDKINAKYRKGVENSIKSVEDLTGVDINGYVVIKTSVLVELVDLIGGVEFDVPIDMDYDDVTQDLHIHLKAGKQMIYGKEAEQLLRFRHNNNGSSYPVQYGDNDYGRMRTQREFIKAVSSQMLSFGNITRINKIINAVSNNLITDLKTNELLAYVPQLAVFNTENLVSEQIPGNSKMLGGISFFLSDKAKTLNLINDLVTEMNSK